MTDKVSSPRVYTGSRAEEYRRLRWAVAQVKK
jgi:hypothetical protein